MATLSEQLSQARAASARSAQEMEELKLALTTVVQACFESTAADASPLAMVAALSDTLASQRAQLATAAREIDSLKAACQQ